MMMPTMALMVSGRDNLQIVSTAPLAMLLPSVLILSLPLNLEIRRRKSLGWRTTEEGRVTFGLLIHLTGNLGTALH